MQVNGSTANGYSGISTINFFLRSAYAITGPNGSGKSTLLQFIAGALMPSEGKIAYYNTDDEPVADYYSLAFHCCALPGNH